MSLLLIVLILVILLGGGGLSYHHYGHDTGFGGRIGLGTVLLVILVVWLLRGRI